LSFLEPRFLEKNQVIYQTVEDVEEMYFVMNGSVDIGFEFNRVIKTVVRLMKGSVIGAYNCTMDKKTIFNYSAHREMDAFTIRKQKWYYLINDPYFEEIALPMRKNIEKNYMSKIKNPIIQF
jgi:hypothetical protein